MMRRFARYIIMKGLKLNTLTSKMISTKAGGRRRVREFGIVRHVEKRGTKSDPEFLLPRI